jgi:hypothetical protein
VQENAGTAASTAFPWVVLLPSATTTASTAAVHVQVGAFAANMTCVVSGNLL